MQLHPIDSPETLTHLVSDSLDQPAPTVEAGLDQTCQPTLQSDSVPDVLDFLSDFQQRCDWVRQVLADN
jgi:hypothetical protein